MRVCVRPSLLLLLLLLLLVFLLFLLLLACGCMSRMIRRGHKYKSFQVEYKYRTTDRVLLEFVLTRSSDGPEQDRMQIPALPCCRCRSASDILLPVIHPTTFLEFVISLVSRLVSYSSPKLASSKQSILSLDRARMIKSPSN